MLTRRGLLAGLVAAAVAPKEALAKLLKPATVFECRRVSVRAWDYPVAYALPPDYEWWREFRQACRERAYVLSYYSGGSA